MCKESWCQIRTKGVCIRVTGGGELSEIPYRGGGTENRGGETKVLKRQKKLSRGVGALKRGGTGTPLRTMTDLPHYHSCYMQKFVPNFILKHSVHFRVNPKNQLIQIKNFYDNLIKFTFQQIFAQFQLFQHIFKNNFICFWDVPLKKFWEQLWYLPQLCFVSVWFVGLYPAIFF